MMIKGLSPPGPSGAAETKLAVAKTLLERVSLAGLQLQLGFFPVVKIKSAPSQVGSWIAALSMPRGGPLFGP